MSIQMLNETITYTHRGVTIYMHLDYEAGTVSLVEKDGSEKRWNFTGRTKEYLGGWWLVLEAMQEAVKYADTRLREQEAARENAKTKEMVDLMVALHDVNTLEDEEQ